MLGVIRNSEGHGMTLLAGLALDGTILVLLAYEGNMW